MIIDWLEYEKKEHVLAWLMVEAISSVGIAKFKNLDSSKLDVIMSINGMEVDLISAMDYLESQLQKIGDEGFKKGVEHTTDKIKDDICSLIDAL